MGMLIKEAYENGWIHGDIFNSLKTHYTDLKCDCGGDIEVDSSLYTIYCSNPYCKLKIADRMYKLAQYIGCKELSYDDCLKLVDTYKIKSPYQLFILKNMEITIVKDFHNVKNKLELFSKQPITLWKAVEIGYIEDISSLAKKLFIEYTSIEQFYNDLQRFELGMVINKLEYESEIAIVIYERLKEYMDELKCIEAFLNIDRTTKNVIHIAIKGAIECYSSKKEFINEINDKYRDSVNICLDSQISYITSVLIIDNKEYYDECIRGRRIQGNAFKENKDITPGIDTLLICTSKDFKDYLEAVYGNEK